MATAGPSSTTEAFSRVKIDAQLGDAGWNLTDSQSVHYEYTLPDGTKADYVLCDRNGRSLAVLEAKRASVDPVTAEGQAKGYAEQLQVPYVFLANGEEVWFWEYGREAHPRKVATFFSQPDLERRAATLTTRADPLQIAIDKKVAALAALLLDQPPSTGPWRLLVHNRPLVHRDDDFRSRWSISKG